MTKIHNGNCCPACCEDNDVCKQTMAEISRCLKEHIEDEASDFTDMKVNIGSINARMGMLMWILGGAGVIIGGCILIAITVLAERIP